MGLGAAGDHRNDAGGSQFRALFNRPGHAVELKYGKNYRDLARRGHWNFGAQFKLHPLFGYVHYAATTHPSPDADIKFLPHPRSQHADKMLGMRTDQGGTVARDLIGDP